MVAILLSVTYFFVQLLTISDYNINWDEPDHFVRGQAYLHYLFTGKKTYDDLPQFKEFEQAAHQNKRQLLQELPRYSIYQSSALSADYHLANDNGHPPLNGIFASLSNYILYQRLGILGDIESYHFFIILVSALLVFLVVFWSMEVHGLFAGIVSFLSLTLYPLFISESHNNIKDPIETTFFAFTIFALYRAIKKISWRWVIVGAISAGFALGTKFNILFAPFIIFPWLGVAAYPMIKKHGIKALSLLPVSFLLSLVIFPFIVIAIFLAGWPFLWQNSFNNFLKILSYYQSAGTAGAPQQFIFGWFNAYAIIWIIITTPLIILFYLLLGIIASFKLIRTDKCKTSLLWILWLLVPVVRVSLSGSGIYGGTRQIMEYLPAAALLCGQGASFIRSRIPVHWLVYVLLFLPIAVKLVNLHPNQSLYFNSLIGGLPGAAKINFPGWNSTLGNPYLQAVQWINENAEPRARVTLALGLMTTIPPTKFREDIVYDNTLKSATFRQGEYIMDLTYYAFPKPYYDAVYPERFLVPIHQIMVDGVPVVNIWKNDIAHTKKGFVSDEAIPLTKIEKTVNSITVSFEEARFLTKIEFRFRPNGCSENEIGWILTSVDGQNWVKEPEELLDNQIPSIKKRASDGRIVHLLAAVAAKYLRVKATEETSCLLDNPVVQVYGLIKTQT